MSFAVKVSIGLVLASLQILAAASQWNPMQQRLSSSALADRTLKALQKAEIIPDVLDDDFEPAFSLGIVYPSAHREVKLGNKIKPADVSSAPVFEIRAGADAAPLTPSPTSRSNATYTLVLTDPDATSRADPIKAEMCHWIVTGINLNVAAASTARLDGPGPEASTASAFHRTSRLGSVQTFRSIIGSSETSQLMSYYPPAPPPKTGYHRYVFVLLAPASTEKDADLMKEPKKPKERPHWGYGKVGKGVRDWADENRLVPVGANFFYARHSKN